MARTGAAFTAAPSRYPQMSVAYTSDGAEDVDAVTLEAALADIAQLLAGNDFPGTRPIHGDTVQLITDITSVTATGSITCQGVLREGRGFVELTLPDADPQQPRFGE
ncbi:hypothetical protein ACWGLG_42015 [Streptomyces antimycoticus]